MNGPRTKAGRQLWSNRGGYQWVHAYEHDLRDIEAEAAAQERERIKAAVLELRGWDKRSVPGGFHINRQAVLDILAEPGS